MKREIKFRGKRIDNGEWIYGYYHANIGNGHIHNFNVVWGPKRELIGKDVNFNNHWILVPNKPDSVGWSIQDSFSAKEVIPESVGQFTGLLDKNGKEIYEGDICAWKFGALSGTSKISFYEGAFHLAEYPFKEHSQLQTGEIIEVIGNIYESLTDDNKQ